MWGGSGLSCLQDRWNAADGESPCQQDEGSMIVSHVPHAISTVSYIFLEERLFLSSYSYTQTLPPPISLLTIGSPQF